MRSNINFDTSFEVTSVGEYLGYIASIYKTEDGQNLQLFFRGQSVDYWDVRPSIYRNNLLSVEHELLAEPVRRVPSEFGSVHDYFEIMEKNQHYGMCTRLLDVSTNPLVALYFACCEKNNKKEKYETDEVEQGVEKRYPHGVVYFTDAGPVLRYDNRIIQIVSFMASLDLSEEQTLGTVLTMMRSKGIISNEYKTDSEVAGLIKALQGVYVVLPIINNERLARQNGAFMMPAKFNFKISQNDLFDSVVQKAECDLRGEFNKTVFYVRHENKDSIIKELNNYGINEASLFPEFEYQLKHIRKMSEERTKLVAKFEETNVLLEQESESASEETVNLEEANRIINEMVKDSRALKDLEDLLGRNKKSNIYKKNSAYSTLKIEMSKVLVKNKYNPDEALSLSQKILDRIINNEV